MADSLSHRTSVAIHAIAATIALSLIAAGHLQPKSNMLHQLSSVLHIQADGQ